MPSQIEFFQLILNDLSDIKSQIGQIRITQTEHTGKLHRRIDEVIEARHQCEMACRERESKAIEREKDLKDDLKERIWKTGGLLAGAVNILVEGAKWLIAKVI